MSVAGYEVLVTVVDEGLLRRHASALNPDLVDATLADALVEGLLNPRTAPLDNGYEVLRAVAAAEGDTGRFRVRVDADVNDPVRLVQAARESHLAAWEDDLEAANLGECLYEHLLGSNASPPHVDVGFEVVDRWFHGDEVPRAVPTP